MGDKVINLDEHSYNFLKESKRYLDIACHGVYGKQEIAKS